MAKSVEQKREEAIARGKRSYFHKVETFLVLCPSFLIENMDDIDFSLWVNHFAGMRRTAKELGINWDGREVYSSEEYWSMRDILESWIRNPDLYMDAVENLSRYLETIGRHVPRQIDRKGWVLRNADYKRVFELPSNQALIDLLDSNR